MEELLQFLLHILVVQIVVLHRDHLLDLTQHLDVQLLHPEHHKENQLHQNELPNQPIYLKGQ